MKRFIATLVVLLVILAAATEPQCSDPGCNELQWGYAYHTFQRYDVHSTSITTKGTRFDPSGLQISPELIDRLTDEVEACLIDEKSSGRAPTCMTSSGKINRESFVVKVASDWVLSCDKTEQLLPVLSGSSGCIAKGLTPTEQCPCRWRAGIECPNVLIVTPSFFLYKDVLIRFVTGCSNPWASEALSKCATPTTSPLSDGSSANIAQ